MAAPSIASAQDAAQEARLRASMSASAYAAFAATVQDARTRGLPTEPLITKGLEGVAKNVPGDRISIAVRGLSQKMVRAQILLTSNRPATAAEIIAVADALQRNVPEDAIRKLTADAGGRATITMTAYALADLLGHGVPLAVSTVFFISYNMSDGESVALSNLTRADEQLPLFDEVATQKLLAACVPVPSEVTMLFGGALLVLVVLLAVNLG